MNLFKPVVLTFTASLLLTGCDRGPGENGSGSTAVNPLLAHVPAGTPYVVANLEPVPVDIMDAYLQRFEPVLAEMQNSLKDAQRHLEENTGPEGHGSDDGARLLGALLAELDGNLNREGLQALGLDLGSHKVLYGMGAFPALRLGLSDPAALKATVNRVLSSAEITAPQKEWQGVSYWRLGDEPGAEPSAGLYVAILEDQLVLGVIPDEAEADLLPGLLGTEMPAASDAQARLAELNSQHGYTPHGTGIVDFRKLADRFLQPETPAARLLAASGEFDAARLSEVCVEEIHGIIDHAPRMTMGTTELTDTAVAAQYRVETPDSLAKQLMALVSRLPAAPRDSDRLAEFSFGMKFGTARDFVLEKANAIVAAPYACEHLQDLNQSALQTVEKLNEPMPPFLNNFRGLRISLSEIMMDENTIPADARGHLAVHVEKPEMFVGMAQMFLPDLSTMTLSPGSEPQRLPDSLLPMPGLVAFAAMSTAAIGLSVGEGEEAGLRAYLDEEPGPEGVFLSADYDTAAYLEHSQKLGAQAQDAAGHEAGAADEMETTEHSSHDIHQAAGDAFRAMADRSHMRLRFTSEGFVADNRMSFKPLSKER
jgi:hypothetical protein